MAKDISLKIYTPEKLAVDKSVYRVVLPDGGQNLTVIKDRAPTSLALIAGVLKILDEHDNVVEAYFVDNGVADIALNECKISTLHLIALDKISESVARSKMESEPESAGYYGMIVKYYTDYPVHS